MAIKQQQSSAFKTIETGVRKGCDYEDFDSARNYNVPNKYSSAIKVSFD